jgi:hypothetical protein
MLRGGHARRASAGQADVRRTALALVAVALLAAGCYGNPTPHTDAAPPDCQPVKLLLVGDSLMVESAKAIVQSLDAAGYQVDALDISHGGSSAAEYLDLFGLKPAEFATPRDELQQALDTFAPDVVVVAWGTNPAWTYWAGGHPTPVGNWLLHVVQEQAMQDVVQQVAAAHAALYWATVPPRGDAAAWYSDDGNEMVKALGVPTIDWRAAVASQLDTFETFLRYPEDGSVHPIRTADGVHFTDDGIARVAKWTTAALAPVACRSAPPPPGP